MPIQPLSPDALQRICDPGQFTFETTADLDPDDTIIGQPQAVRAIEFGLGIESHGYNIFIIGETGTGHTATIERFLKTHAAGRPTPPDWVYVYNFKLTHRPKAISLPAGVGQQLKEDMERLMDSLKKELPDAFDTEAYRDASEHIKQEYKDRRDQMLAELRTQAAEEEMTIVNTPSGFVVTPLLDGKAMTADEFRQLPVDQHQELDKKRQEWDEKLSELLDDVRQLDTDAREKINELDRDVAASTMRHYFDQLREQYDDYEVIRTYVDDVYEDVLDHLDDFLPSDDDDKEADLRRYEVNLLVDNSRLSADGGAPVVVELYPRYTNLLGRIEYESQHSTHFTNLKAGSIHRANGGYLVLTVSDLLKQRNAWDGLKRALKSREIQLQPPDRADGNQVLAKSVDPEPVPLDVKVILLGGPDHYYRLYNHEDDFSELFKVKAEFDTVMPRNTDNELAYATFVASRCLEEKLRPFDPTAVAQIVAFGSRQCSHQKRLSTRFERIADLIREAGYWAGQAGRGVVTAEDVKQALREQRDRSNLDERHTQEDIAEGTLYITTDGREIGQVNGLAVIDLGDYAYGQPGRITARTYKGERGIVNIDREVDLTGPIHHKGLLTLSGYLGGMYAQDQPLSLSASVTFEQNYGLVDGDSASSTELYSILSAVAQLPIKQGVAVTGSVNQKGQIQPIGGVVEKIEGFFDVCSQMGLTGKQGVIIPKANKVNLMLRDEVVTAVETGTFHIWGIETIEEGMEILTDVTAAPADEDGTYPPESLHGRVMAGLERLSKDDDDDDDDDDNDDDQHENSEKEPREEAVKEARHDS